MIVAIVQDEDAGHLVDEMTEHGLRVTKLATTGGFLRAGNTTLLSGVEDDEVDMTLSLIEKTCRSRETMTAVAPVLTGEEGAFTPVPVQVRIGGATVFVLEISQFLKV